MLDILTQKLINHLQLGTLEPLRTQLSGANKQYKSAIDFKYAYAHATIDDENIKLTRFLSGEKLFAFVRGFYGFTGFQNFFTQRMSSFFKDLIQQGSALVYNDDIPLMPLSHISCN